MEPYQLGRTANPYFWKLWYPSSWCLSSLVLAQTAEQYVLQIHLNIFVTLHTVISFFIFIHKILNFLLSQKWLGTWSQSVCPMFDWVFSPIRVWVPALWKKTPWLVIYPTRAHSSRTVISFWLKILMIYTLWETHKKI